MQQQHQHKQSHMTATRRRRLLTIGAAVLALVGLGRHGAGAGRSLAVEAGQALGRLPAGRRRHRCGSRRNLQPGLQEALGQQVIVEYKPGAGRRRAGAATELTRASADGYTILVANIGPFVLVPEHGQQEAL